MRFSIFATASVAFLSFFGAAISAPTTSVCPSAEQLAIVDQLVGPYEGCHIDDPSNRSLIGYASLSSDIMSPGICADMCKSKGFKLSGTEYGQECFCGNTIATAQTSSIECTMTCKGGYALPLCGGPNRLSVYQIL